MEIVKKNLVSIICGVIAIIAVIAVWPIDGRFTALQEKANARKGVYDQLKNLLDKERHLPVVSLDPAATPQKLEGFPTEPVITRGNEIKEKMKAQADEMFKKAVTINQTDKRMPKLRNAATI